MVWLQFLLHPCLSIVAILQSLILISFKSSSTICNHLIRDLFLLLLPNIIPDNIRFVVLFNFAKPYNSLNFYHTSYEMLYILFHYFFLYPSFLPKNLLRTFLSKTSTYRFFSWYSTLFFTASYQYYIKLLIISRPTQAFPDTKLM